MVAYAPAAIDWTADSTDDFEVSRIVNLPGWTGNFDGCTFHMQLRRAAGDLEVALEFSSGDGSINLTDPLPLADPPSFTLNLYRPAAAVAAMGGIYQADLKMLFASRKINIAEGIITFRRGITIEA